MVNVKITHQGMQWNLQDTPLFLRPYSTGYCFVRSQRFASHGLSNVYVSLSIFRFLNFFNIFKRQPCKVVRLKSKKISKIHKEVFNFPFVKNLVSKNNSIFQGSLRFLYAFFFLVFFDHSKFE